MPIVRIELLEGRLPATKSELIRRVTDAVVVTLKVRPEQVRVLLYEVPPQHWAWAERQWRMRIFRKMIILWEREIWYNMRRLVRDRKETKKNHENAALDLTRLRIVAGRWEPVRNY